jgi:hypothetical protein
MHIQEVGCKAWNGIYLTEDTDRWLALVNAAMNLHLPQTAGNFLTN